MKKVNEVIHVRRKRCPRCGCDVSYRDTVCCYCGNVLYDWKVRRRGK